MLLLKRGHMKRKQKKKGWKKRKKQLPHNIHDRGYKLLFSFGKIFQQLIEGYVDRDWKKFLDFSNAQKIDKSFILKDFEQIEADVLYKVPVLEQSQEIYLYVLVEFQSTVDHSIAFRVLSYLSQVWIDVCKNIDPNLRKQKGFRLPPVFPIVVYNGSESWTAKKSVRELVDMAEIFGEFIPNVQYHLINISDLNIEKLQQLGNALAGVFLLEHKVNSEEFEKAFKEALKLIFTEPDYELVKAIIQWILALLKREFPKQAPALVQEIDFTKYNREEVRTMLETMPKKLIAYGEEEGEKKGKRVVAKNMLAEGYAIAAIAKVTGLSADEIRKLKAEPGKPS